MRAETTQSNRFVLDVKGAAELRNTMKQDPEAGLKQAAVQFEGMMLQMMLKSMRDASPQDGLMNNDQTRFYTSIMDQQLAQNLAGRSKLGFAQMIEKQLGKSLGSPPPGSSAEAALQQKPIQNNPTASAEALQQALLQRQAATSAGSAGQGAGQDMGRGFDQSVGYKPRQTLGQGAPRIRSAPVSAPVPLSAAEQASTEPRDFVNKIWPHALAAGSEMGVPAQFLVAHSALESGWGKSEIRAENGAPSYNLFGIKAGKSWQGATVEVQTTEYVNGAPQSVREKFRAYGSYAESFRDYANLLRNNARFSGVLGQQDGTQFARSLQQSGYATDPMYADKLGRIINGTTLRQALYG